MNIQRQLIHGLVLGDTMPSARDKDRVRNEFALPERLQFVTGATALKFDYEYRLENEIETRKN